MNTLRNKVQLIGHLGQNPEKVNYGSGKYFVKFSMATNDAYKNNNGENIKNTQWHNIVVWGSLAKIASEYLKKGQEVAIEGKLLHRTYQDKEGNNKYITEIVANDLLFLGKK